ncbi:MAG TPA: SulP family inorganic anion transporter [Opitutales bacterium]|nr:SulP family inorganic anion transporter [Opitutales bacterium]
MAKSPAKQSRKKGPSSPFVLPILRELYNYSFSKFNKDLIAGITVALVSIPQTIGFSLIIGVPAQIVLYAAIVGVFFTALFSSSHHLVSGPTTTISIILASTIATVGGEINRIHLIVALAMLIGLIQIVAGLVKLGSLNRFISRAVIVGYTTGVSLLIVAGQIPNLFGMSGASAGDFISVVLHVARNLYSVQLNLTSMMVGVMTILFLILLARLRPRWPGGLIVLIISGSAAALFNLGERFGVRLIRDVGEILPELPTFGGGPEFYEIVSYVPHLMSPAIAIAILGMLETVSLGKAIAVSSGQRINANQEIIGLGVGNVMSSMFGTMPGSASFARTATNFQSGGQTQVSAVVSSAMVALIILLFARLANFIPIPTLAGMLIFIGIRMVHPGQISIAVKSTRSDAIVFAATFLAALFLRLDTAIYVGVGVSLVLFLRKAAMPHLVEYGFTDSGALSELDSKEKRENNQISIIHVEGELFFGAAEIFQDQIRAIAEDEHIRIFILRLKNARHVDATSIVALNQLLDFLNKTDRYLLISGINPEIERVFVNSGFMDRIGRENVFHSEANPTMSTKRALLRASHLLQTTDADIRIFYDESRKDPKGESPHSSEPEGPNDFQI